MGWKWDEKGCACSEQCKQSRPTYIIFYLHLRRAQAYAMALRGSQEVRRHPEEAGFLLPPYGSWALNSGPWAYVFLPETLWWPVITFLICGWWDPQMEKLLQEAHCINCRTTMQLESKLDKFYGSVQSFPNMCLPSSWANAKWSGISCSLSSNSCLWLLGVGIRGVYGYWSGPQRSYSRSVVCWQRG